MARCFHCRQRKAKRRCTALGEELCSLCCGRLRNREIRCLPDCPVLTRHSPYQDRRAAERNEEEFLQDERLLWLTYHAERPLRALAEHFPSFSDEDAVLALEYAREQTARAHSLILLPGAAARPRHEAGEAVFQSLEACRFEGRIILSGREAVYSREEKLRVLDRLLSAARSLSGGNPGGQEFLQLLLERHRRAEGIPGPGKIISSD